MRSFARPCSLRSSQIKMSEAIMEHVFSSLRTPNSKPFVHGPDLSVRDVYVGVVFCALVSIFATMLLRLRDDHLRRLLMPYSTAGSRCDSSLSSRF